MKPILLVSEFFPPDPGGIQRSLELLAPAWGSDVVVITPVGQRTYPGPQRSLFSGKVRPRWLWLVGEFWRRGLKEKRLLVFGHYSAAVLAAWLLRPLGLRYVVLTHGNDVLIELQRRLGWVVKLNLRGAEWVGVNSTWLAKKIITLGVPPIRVIKTHPAVRDTEISTTDVARKRQMIVTIARLVPRKNVATVLHAIAQLLPKIPELQYHVIGDGPERESLQRLAIDLGLASVVTWHGQTSESVRREILQRASVFVLTPTIREKGTDVEGLGAVYLEAAAAGLPIIAAPTGGVPDAVQNGVTGLLVDPDSPEALAEAIHRLLREPDVAHSYGESGQELIKQEFLASVRTGRAARMLRGWPADEQPKISVIIPAYNSAKSISATLQSLWRQTWKNIEVIVVDDGSTDNLAEILATENHPLIVIRQENSGAPAARNRGAAAATGHWWIFLDADTVLTADALETMAIHLSAHPEVAYVYSDFRFGFKNFHLHDFSETILRQRNYIHTSSLLRPSAWPGFDIELQRFQDWDLWLTMLANGHRGLWIPRRLFSVADTGGMSRWLPSFVYRLPLIGQGIGNTNIKKYRQAEAVIRQKHGL